MDQVVGLDQDTPHDEQKHIEQQIAIEQEPTSEPFQPIPPDQITQEGNEAYLRQHQRHLRSSFPSCDLSEVSYHTEHTDFPGSRHSSLNTEPLTLDAEQIHDAKVSYHTEHTDFLESRESSVNTEPLTLDAQDQAVDVLQKADTDKAFKIFTKDLRFKCEESPSPESESKALEDQISTLLDKTQQIVETNEQSGSKITMDDSTSLEEKKRPEEPVTSLEEDVKLKAD